jgi:hypothetical protein
VSRRVREIDRAPTEGTALSHHFDTPTAREDPRLNLCDTYLFAGSGDSTVMAMTVNPAATPQTKAPFREEAVYAFRFDTDGDGRDDVSFEVHFTSHGERQQPTAVAKDGPLVGIPTFAGVVRDPFAGDAQALETFKSAFAEGRYTPSAFGNHVNFFHDRCVAAIVLEVPNTMISTTNDAEVHAWTTVSLRGHAPEKQVARWGLPLFTHMFLPDVASREHFNRSRPSDDNAPFLSAAATTAAAYARIAGSTPEPDEYGARVAARLGSLTLPYRLGSAASFDFTGFNGRALGDNVMDTMLTLLTNKPLGTGIAPDPSLFDSNFPYLQPLSHC